MIGKTVSEKWSNVSLGVVVSLDKPNGIIWIRNFQGELKAHSYSNFTGALKISTKQEILKAQQNVLI